LDKSKLSVNPLVKSCHAIAYFCVVWRLSAEVAVVAGVEKGNGIEERYLGENVYFLRAYET
jgi:hypothetical protein